MAKFDRILELVDDLTQDQTEQLVGELFQILDEEHFQNIKRKFFAEVEEDLGRSSFEDTDPDAPSS